MSSTFVFFFLIIFPPQMILITSAREVLLGIQFLTNSPDPTRTQHPGTTFDYVAEGAPKPDEPYGGRQLFLCPRPHLNPPPPRRVRITSRAGDEPSPGAPLSSTRP